MFGRGPTQPEQALLPVLPVSQPVSHVYQQWYERDPDLFSQEKVSLEGEGFQPDCRRLPDARASFVVTIAGKTTVLICGYNHPMEPPTAQIVDDIEAPSVVDPTGKVDLFAHDGFSWAANLRLSDVAQRIATLLSVAGVSSPATAERANPIRQHNENTPADERPATEAHRRLRHVNNQV